MNKKGYIKNATAESKDTLSAFLHQILMSIEQFLVDDLVHLLNTQYPATYCHIYPYHCHVHKGEGVFVLRYD